MPDSTSSRLQCHSPICTRTRRPNQLLCHRCFLKLPAPIRPAVLARVKSGSIRTAQNWSDTLDIALAAQGNTDVTASAT